jgi:transcriptional regulator with XRE-family HTH domain
MASFGARLRVLRAALDVSQTELSSRSGFAPATLSHLETGKNHPRAATVAAVAEALGVPSEALRDDHACVTELARILVGPPQLRTLSPADALVAGLPRLDELVARGLERLFKVRVARGEDRDAVAGELVDRYLPRDVGCLCDECIVVSALRESVRAPAAAEAA